jgi:hypothetical protein
MEIRFNVTGPRRKEMVKAVSEIADWPIEYKGAPTFAYLIGDFTVDKEGTLSFSDRTDSELVENLIDGLVKRGFDFESSESDEYPDIDQHHPGRYADNSTPFTEAMQNELDESPSFEDLEMTEKEELGLGKQRRDHRGEDGMQTSDVPDCDESAGLTIEMPLEGYTEENIANLEKLIASKAGLIKKAIGAYALSIERTETTLKFPWFAFGASGEEADAYSRLISALYTAAKEQKRVTAKDKDVENEKFAFRVFLIRLGFLGDEYKSARKILLRNLSGNSAFKNGGKTTKTEVSGDE